MDDPVRVAAVQATPVFLDRDATTERACELIADASRAGAKLVVFPESFIPAYPDWVWRRRPWDDGEAHWFNRFWSAAVDVRGADVEKLAASAAEGQIWVVMGVTERTAEDNTLYNTLLFISPEEGLVGRHRKLMPTGAERLVWGPGDGAGLTTYPTPFGPIGGLICWENYMPLARTALYAAGIDIYLAPTWDNSDEWVPTLRHIAKEGRCFVIGVSPFLRGSDVPADIPGRDEIYGGEDDWMSRGNATVVDPFGRIIAGPLVGEAGILTADLDLRLLPKARQQFDAVGHYARPDVFGFEVRSPGGSP